MTPEQKAAFLTVYRGLPRAGPGRPEDVRWAVAQAARGGSLRVLDAACGPGADLVTLAQALPKARIEGLDHVPQFVDAARRRSAGCGERVTVALGDMRRPEGKFDLIWCAGALYFLGVTEGLRAWRAALTADGVVAFSEPVLLNRPANGAVIAFWEEYPQVTDFKGINEQVEAAGYARQAHRNIVGDPWKAYYDPLQERVTALREMAPGPDLAHVLDDTQREIDRWHAAPDEIAYALLLVAPV